MFITNNDAEILKTVYRCNEILAKYLIYSCNIPLLAIDGDKYLFANTIMLKRVLNDLPLKYKLLKHLN